MTEEIYPVNFSDPPFQLRNKTILIYWWISKPVRDILSSSPWVERLRETGETPYFCFNEGFCACYESRTDLENHYQEFPDHRLTKAEVMAKEQITLMTS